MAKVTLTDLVSSFLSKAGLNNNFQKIGDALNNKVLYRDNPAGEPNQMNSLLDMNSQRIINLPPPLSQSDALRLADIPEGTEQTSASFVTVADTAEVFDETNVEGVLNELHDEIADLSGVEDAATARTNLDVPSNDDIALPRDPEDATENGTDTYVSELTTTPPADGEVIVRDFQSVNTTTTPTLDGKTLTTVDGSTLWAGAILGPHTLQYASGTDTYLVLEPTATAANVSNAPVARDSNGRAKFSDPSAAQDAATKAYTDAATLKVFHYNSGNASEQTTSLDVSAATFEVIYTVEVSIEVGDIIQVMGEAEFTSDDPDFNYFIASKLILATSSTATTGDEISEANGRNITPETHHETQPKVGTIVSPYTGTYYVNYIARAASTSGTTDPTVESDFGRLSVIVLRP